MSDETKEKSADAAGIEEAGFDSQNNSREETEAIMEAESPDDVDDDLLEQIEEERKERLDPDNRPDGAEVDNTQRTFIAEEARFEDSELDADDGIGQKEPDPETQAGSSDDSDESEDDSDDSDEPTDEADEGDSADEREREASESDAGTGPEPTEGTPSEGGKHKA